ncbi:MAG: Glycosyl transferases group 1 [Methanomassiliicoccales archaeon PtaU1.Bin124]|nr:MAG: Glycosyl transferases group 1 [Methanomassiliicoccales archaeon PtaU1.Bin124]
MKDCDMIISVATRGGSWKCLVNLEKNVLDHSKLIIVTLGDKTGFADLNDVGNYTSIVLPYDRFDTGMGKKLGGRAVRNILYFVPLAIVANYAIFFSRPNKVIANGLPSAISIAPLAKMIGTKVVCSYHGAVKGYVNDRTQKMLSKLLSLVDIIIVNSMGSFKEINALVSEDKIFPLEHTADDVYFTERDRKEVREELELGDRFVIIFIGRLDKDKIVDRLLAQAERFKNDPRFLFIFLGVGEFEATLEKMVAENGNVRYLRYVNDKNLIAKLLKGADLAWSYADESYIARPGVESIASGTPVLIPDVPAVSFKAETGVKVPQDLIPENVGWIMDVSRDEKITEFLLELQRTRRTDDMRDDVLAYGRKHYSNASREEDYKKISKKLKG